VHFLLTIFGFIGVFVLGIYSTLEDKWYDFLDKINEKIPIYKIIDPIDKVVPSFLLFLALILLLIILTIVMLPVFAPGVNEPQFEVNVTVLSSKTGIPLGAVDLTISGNCMGEERIFEQKTNSEGKAKFTICTDDIKIAAKKENYYPSSKPVFLREEKNPVLRLMPVEITDEEKPVFVKIVDEYDDILIGAKLWSVCDGVSLYQGEQTQVGFDVDFGSCSIAQFKVSVEN